MVGGFNSETGSAPILGKTSRSRLQITSSACGIAHWGFDSRRP